MEFIWLWICNKLHKNEIFSTYMINFNECLTNQYSFVFRGNWRTLPIGVYRNSQLQFFFTAANVINFRILSTGKTFIYLLTNMLNAILLFLAILLGRIFSEKWLTIGLTLGAALYFITVWVYQYRNEREQFDGKRLKDHYTIGFSSFVINSIVPFILAADKFIINHNFENITTNSYTFSWGLTAPLFYIGNIFGKMIFVERKEVTKKMV